MQVYLFFLDALLVVVVSVGAIAQHTVTVTVTPVAYPLLGHVVGLASPDTVQPWAELGAAGGGFVGICKSDSHFTMRLHA